MAERDLLNGMQHEMWKNLFKNICHNIMVGWLVILSREKYCISPWGLTVYQITPWGSNQISTLCLLFDSQVILLLSLNVNATILPLPDHSLSQIHTSNFFHSTNLTENQNGVIFQTPMQLWMQL
jgi:hypothetical protein